MATDWQDNFRKRCEAVGWRVERTTSNHFKTYDSEGKLLLTFSGTPGDKRGMMNALSQAKRCGIEMLERNAKLERERDRLQKIEDDRAAADRKIDIINDHADASAQPNLGNVDGVAIVAIAPAMYKSPVMEQAAPLAAGEELLLASGRVVYRCARSASTVRRPDLEGICHRTYLTVESLKSHISYHTRQWKTREAEVASGAGTTETHEPPSPVAAHSAEFDALDHALAQLQNGIKRIADQLPGLIIEVGTLRDAVRRLPVADAETVNKAQQFDALRGMFKD